MADPWLQRNFSEPYANPDPNAGGTSWFDYPKAFGGAVAGLIGDQGAGLRALAESADDPEEKMNKATGYLGQAVQTLFGGLEEGAIDSMTPAAKERIQSTMTDPDFWTLSAMTLKGTQMAPSIAAVAVPSYLLSGVGLGTATTAAIGGEMSAASVVDEMYRQTDSLSDGELRAQVPVYDDMRRNGSSPEEARREYNKLLRGLKPLYAAGIGAIANVLGPAGQVARGVAGKGASALAEEGAGIVGRTLASGAEGAIGGGLQAGGEELLIQQGAADAGLTPGVDYGAVAEAAGTGTVLGGVLGGAAGAGFHGGGRRATPGVDPTLDVVLQEGNGSNTGVPGGPEPVTVAPPSSSGTQATPGVPDVVAAPEVATDPYAGMTPREKRDALAKEAFENPEVVTSKVTQTAPPTGPDAAQTLALTNEAPAPAVSPPPETVKPAAVDTSSPTAAAPVPEAPRPVETPRPVEPPTVDEMTPGKPVEDLRPPEPKNIMEPEAPRVPGPRILEDVSPEGREAATKVDQAWDSTIGKNIKDSEPVEDTGPTGRNRTLAEKAEREAVRAATKQLAQKYPPHADEALVYSKKPKEVTGARARILDRAKAITEEANAMGLKLPKSFRDNAGGDGFNPETLLVMEAKRLAEKAAPSKADFERFVKREFDVRSGGIDDAITERRIEGDIAKRGGDGREIQVEDIKDAETPADRMTPEELLIRQEDETGAVPTSRTRPEDVPKSIDDALDEALYTTPKATKAPVVVEKRRLGRIVKPEEKTAERVQRPANTDKPLPPKLKEVKEHIDNAKRSAEVYRKSNEEAQAKAKELARKSNDALEKMKQGNEELRRVIEKHTVKPEVKERIEAARQQTNTAPTDAQKEAGNYKKGRVSISGHEIAIENPKGSERSGVGADGERWSVKMPVDYGYLEGTRGADGDAIDVFVGPDHDATFVYVVDQVDPVSRAFDEHKVMLGFKNEMSAVRAYDRSFSDGMGALRMGELRKMTHEEFRKWKSEKQEAPASGRAEMIDPDLERSLYMDYIESKGVTPEGYVKDPITRKFAKPVQSGTASEYMWGSDLNNLRGMPRVMAGTARNILTKLVGDTPVHFLAKEDLARFAGRSADNAPYGFYAVDGSGKEHGIFINSDLLAQPDKLRHTMWHEATHAATLRQVIADKHLNKTIRALMTHVSAELEKMADVPEDVMTMRYGMTKPEEFVAEAFSNPAFQDVLSRMPATPEVAKFFKLSDLNMKNLWDVFVSAVRRALGMPREAHNMLEAAIKVTEMSMTAKRAEYEGRAERRLLDDGDPRSVADSFKEQLKTVLQRPELAPTKGNPQLLGLRTFDNIARMADRYFGGNNPVRKIANIMESQRVAAQRDIEKATPMINRLHALEKKYKGGVWEDFTRLVHDETMANVYADRPLSDQKHISKDGARDAWAREQHKDLADAYAKLPEDLKAARKEAMTYFTAKQNELSLKLIRNRIVTLFDTPDPEGLAKRIHENTVTDADKALMGEAYDAIAAAGSLSKIDGPYFPLMRRGNYVVKGTYKVTEPKNATKISDNEFEFTDKDAAAKFAAVQDGRPTIRTIYVNKNTGETQGTEGGKTYRYTKEDIDAVPRYRVAVQNRHMEMFDTMRQARARVAELRAAGMNVDDAVPRQFENYGIQADALSSQMRRLATVMERRADARNYTAEQKDDLLRTLNEVSLSMLGSTRIQSRNLPRRYVAGASRDLLRNTVEYAHATGNYTAKLDFRPQLDAALTELNDATKANPQDGFASGRQAVANEVMRRVTTPNPAAESSTGNALTNRILSMSFMDKLMSPTYSVINATQPMMTTTPYLAGQYGVGRAAAAMAKAYSDIGTLRSLKQGFKDTASKVRGELQTNDPVSLIMSRLADKGELDMMNILLDRGIIDSDSGLEVGQLVRDQRKIVGALDGGIGYLEGIARQMPKTIEAINRSVSALAAYRLEMERSNNHARAVQFAQDTVNMTQFNYSTSNTAPWMRHPVMRLALQFKKYGLGMYQMLGEQAAIAVRNENPGDRARAIKSLSYTLGMHALMAGTMGLPTEPIKLAVTAANGLGLADWSWGDVEDAQREVMADLFGKEFGEIVSRGIPRAAGIDLSSRMGLDTLMGPFGEPRSNEAQDYKAWAWDALAGAPAGLVADWGSGINSIANGDFMRGIEKLIPIKVVSDSIKAYRVMTEGNVSARTGKQTMSPYSPLEAVTKAVGFTPAREAESYEANSAFYRAKGAQEDRRREFLRDWVGANGAARGRLWREVVKWNRTVAPEARLSISDMRAYQKKMERDIQSTREGINAKRREKTLQKRTEKTYDFLP
ncbi:hypothetical protein EVB41_084 [Rhizobium phage RHph_TM3_14A]|nr:hypothetical protein EVB41_084 [Rhizobium phage RHph_TM3_14A]